jgi:hypothetical protein
LQRAATNVQQPTCSNQAYSDPFRLPYPVQFNRKAGHEQDFIVGDPEEGAKLSNFVLHQQEVGVWTDHSNNSSSQQQTVLNAGRTFTVSA